MQNLKCFCCFFHRLFCPLLPLAIYFLVIFWVFSFSAYAQKVTYQVSNQKGEITGHVTVEPLVKDEQLKIQGELWQSYDKAGMLFLKNTLYYDQETLQPLSNQVIDFREKSVMDATFQNGAFHMHYEKEGKDWSYHHTWQKKYVYFDLLPNWIRQQKNLKGKEEVNIFSPLVIFASKNIITSIPFVLESTGSLQESKNSNFYLFQVHGFLITKLLPKHLQTYSFVFNTDQKKTLKSYILGEYTYTLVEK